METLALTIVRAAEGLAIVWAVVLVTYAPHLWRSWCEPMLRHPILIFESDDWGPGPASHAPALRRLTECLSAFHDSTGRRPVMTLGLTLSLPDGAAIQTRAFAAYRELLITDPIYSDILDAIHTGIDRGVFTPQLHGMAHYWPDALLQVARTDSIVRQWLISGSSMETEALPSHLQSRWVDASTLPSRPLPQYKVREAVNEEVACFRRVFGHDPEVAVPPTFIWNRSVENAWAKAGVRCVITPGLRYEARDAAGRPAQRSRAIRNGDPGPGGLLYLVRDVYFEPARGHKAEQAMEALAAKTRQGRPCLLETHRNNFTGDAAHNALQELRRLLIMAREHFPHLRYTSSVELAQQYRSHGDWIERRLAHRLQIWSQRILVPGRFQKLARLTGLKWVLHYAAGSWAA